MKVMICEDNSEKAKVLTDLLTVYHLRLIRVTSDGDFYKQVEAHRPSVIIVNESFAQEAGKDIVGNLRSNPDSSLTPVIFITNNGELSTEFKDLAADALVELMREPFRIKHLRHCIDRWTTFRSLHIKQ